KKAHFVSTMRISKVTGCKYLMWFYYLQKIHCLNNVVFDTPVFRMLGTVVKWKVLKMDIFIMQTCEARACQCLAFANKAVYNQNFTGISLVWLFTIQEIACIRINLL